MLKKQLLVVDDSPTDRQIVDDAARPPLIVLDIILPKMNGYQVLRQLKTAPETRHIKVVLLSSKSQESDKYWGLKQGADDYIAKPYPDETLLAAVARHF